MKFKTILLLSIFFLIQISCSKDGEYKNDEPIAITISDFIIDLNEFPQANKSIGFIQGRTNKGNLTFSITSQSPENCFTIDSETGELKVLNESLYNFDINPIISGTVKARNGEASRNCNITINVINVEKIFNGSIHIESQTQLESFASNFYDRVNGSIMLSGKTVINTTNLNSIKFIDGNIIVMGTNIKNIDGFTNTNISNDATIQIINNQNLENLNGLENVTNRLTTLSINYNPLINNIDGLKNISNVTNEIEISDTEYLTNLNGLSGINSHVRFLSIRGNKAIVDTDGLSNIPSITSFSFTNNDLVTSLSDMSSLLEVDHFFLDRNAKLENIKGLIELETCKDLIITNNVSLKNLDGLIKLRHVNDGSMQITGNISLKDFCGLSLISTISTVGYNIRDNLYNPTKDDIKNGNCSI